MRQLELFPTLPLIPPPDAVPPFSVIYTDPPWLFEVYNAATTDPSRYIGNKYPIMSRDALCALPISRIVAPNCALFMWATKPNLLDAIAVLEAWGFKYTTIAWVWIKLTPRGARWNMGAGYYTRATFEPCLLGIRGSMPVSDHSVLDILETESDTLVAPVREHSRKPEVAYEMIDRLYPRSLYPNRAEIFASPFSAPLANRHGFATPGFGSTIESYLDELDHLEKHP